MCGITKVRVIMVIGLYVNKIESYLHTSRGQTYTNRINYSNLCDMDIFKNLPTELRRLVGSYYGYPEVPTCKIIKTDKPKNNAFIIRCLGGNTRVNTVERVFCATNEQER